MLITEILAGYYEPDETGRRSPVKSGEQFTIPCDMVISAVGEQVDADLMAANGIEMERKGPAFETNVPGVYCAGDAHRGPATVVEGIAGAATAPLIRDHTPAGGRARAFALWSCGPIGAHAMAAAIAAAKALGS